ncbi:MAG: hypothetical protein J0H65_16730 [Rhizobiales bacterium]|nr:hypothetical protein [Hyphomicrobiales bacterium]
MQFRKVPWKRNYAKVPPLIQQRLKEIKSSLIEVAQTKLIPLSDIARGLYKHVGLVVEGDRVVAQAARVPPENSGKWSFRNVEGWERKRRDLPMITKTYTWETPNFGDASTYGTHMHSQDREVYQVEFDEPRAHEVKAEILKEASGEPSSVLVKFSLTSLFDIEDDEFQKEFLWAINVLQENTGVTGVFASDATKEDYIGTIELNWEVFPPGTADEIISAFRKKRRGRATKADSVMEERLKLFASLKPTAYMSGAGKFSAYVGAQSSNDLVVFETVRYGNALYVLYDTWREVSKRSRIDLLRGTSERFDRFPHSEGWEDRFLEHIALEQDKRKKPKR